MVRYRKPDRTTTKKRGFRTKRDANLFLASVEVDMATGAFIDPALANKTIVELGPSWLERKQGLKPSAYRPLEIAWRVHLSRSGGKSQSRKSPLPMCKHGLRICLLVTRRRSPPKSTNQRHRLFAPMVCWPRFLMTPCRSTPLDNMR